MKNQMIIDYLKNKSVFKFEIINDEKLINILDDIQLIMVVKKQDNYLLKENKRPMISLVLKNSTAFIKYVKYTNYYELNKLSKLKFLNAYRSYCKDNEILTDYYADDMLITISNLQQQIQAMVIEKKLSDIKDIVDTTLNFNNYELKADDTPMLQLVFDDSYVIKPNIEHLIRENVNNFIKEEVLRYTDVFEDILQVEMIKEKKDQ